MSRSRKICAWAGVVGGCFYVPFSIVTLASHSSESGMFYGSLFNLVIWGFLLVYGVYILRKDHIESSTRN